VSLIAGDQIDQLEIEHLLFPERSDDARSARAFINTLREIRHQLDGLVEAQPFAQWISSWREQNRIDRYALVSLTRLRGALGGVLHQDHRRAVHLPDFHQLCRREALLSEKVGEIEALHCATWSTLSVPAETYGALVWRTLELAAILDVGNLLKNLIDGELVDRLRRTECPDASFVAGDPLRRLVREDDLRTVIDLLRGSIRKRCSLQVRPPVSPLAAHAGSAAQLPSQAARSL
jgi:hypothetical protein